MPSMKFYRPKPIHVEARQVQSEKEWLPELDMFAYFSDWIVTSPVGGKKVYSDKGFTSVYERAS